MCDVDGCNHPPAPGGLCWGHRKQKQRGRQLTPLQPRGRAPGQVLEAAALNLADASSEDESAYHRAKVRLKMAALRYASCAH